MFKKLQENRTSQNGELYHVAKRNIAIAKKAKSQELAAELDSEEGR